MLPYFHDKFGNAAAATTRSAGPRGSGGERARRPDRPADQRDAEGIIFTKRATESNNLALKGGRGNVREKGNHIISK